MISVPRLKLYPIGLLIDIRGAGIIVFSLNPERSVASENANWDWQLAGEKRGAQDLRFLN